MKRIFFLIVCITNAHAFEVISERSWVTGSGKGSIHSSLEMYNKLVGAGVILVNQYGFQGIETNIYSTHTFYIHKPYSELNLLKANLCDSYNNCFHHEKLVKVNSFDGLYIETVYLTLLTYGNKVGQFPIYADTTIEGSPSFHEKKEASLILSPFPYDD